MTKHVHAELMMQYAKDAMTTDEPWSLWEVRQKDVGEWSDLVRHPSWYLGSEYRRKPEVIKVGDYEFPKHVANHPI